MSGKTEERAGEGGGAERTMRIAGEMADQPLGFAVDAGSSVLKVAYRSKEDYSAGRALKPRHDPEVGVLRLRNFSMDRVGEIVGFLKENCDVSVDPDDDVEWCMTGSSAIFFKKELDSKLRIKTKLIPDMMAMTTCVSNFGRMEIEFFEVDLEALIYAKNLAAEFLNIVKLSEQMERDKRQGKTEAPKEEELPPGLQDRPSMKLFACEDVATWAEEHLSYTGKIEYPSLLVHLGSAGPMFLVNDGDCKLVEFLNGIGKCLSGLAEELTGEADFGKFIEMAERGKLENVDLTIGDFANPEYEEDYELNRLPANFTIFELGKLSSSNIKGKGSFNKDDLAVGLLSAMIKLASRVIFLSARLYNVKSILLAGSLPDHWLVRHHLQRCLLTESILNNVKGMDLIKVHVFQNPGFICSLGIWWENVERQRERKKNQP